MGTPSQQTPNQSTDQNYKRRVLVVEDELAIRQLIALHLDREGFVVDEVGDGAMARDLLESRAYDLLILDWMVPSVSGLELTHWLRKNSALAQIPILFVTARTEPEYVAAGLDAGADDYITKPFDTIVLMARVHALLRRHQWLRERLKGAQSQVVVGELALDNQTFDVQLAGKKLDLTRSEFRLLETLMLHQGKVLSREALIEQIQGEGVNVIGRTIDTHVFGLRKKLGDWSEMIETIRGVGYRVRITPK